MIIARVACFLLLANIAIAGDASDFLVAINRYVSEIPNFHVRSCIVVSPDVRYRFEKGDWIPQNIKANVFSGVLTSEQLTSLQNLIQNDAFKHLTASSDFGGGGGRDIHIFDRTCARFTQKQAISFQ